MDLDGITGLEALALAGGQYFVLQPRLCGFDALFGSILSQIGLAFFAVLVCQRRKGCTLLFHFAALERLHHFSYLLLIQCRLLAGKNGFYTLAERLDIQLFNISLNTLTQNRSEERRVG